MLISTSRKPSQKTRIFCKNLSHALGLQYINRGKMSMRELQIKSESFRFTNIALVYEMKGNPSKITFFSNDGEEILVILGSVNTTNKRLGIKTEELSFYSEYNELNILEEILPISKDSHHKSSKENHIYIEKIEEDYDDEEDFEDYNRKIAIIHFFNKEGKDTGLKINVRKVI